MVLIITKKTVKRCDVLFVPIKPLIDMLQRHVHRKGLKPDCDTTCIVNNSDGHWADIPKDKEVVQLLIETLKLPVRRVLEGENKYPFAPTPLRCRSFQPPNWAVSSPYEGSFAINFEKIKGRARKAIEFLKSYEALNVNEKEKIENTFIKILNSCEMEFVFVLTHIHPVRKSTIIGRLGDILRR